MNQEPASKHPQYLAVSELRPTVHLAGYYHFTKSVCFQYRMPSHHLILIESGRIEAQTMYGVFQAKANDLLCFRPAEWNQYETHSPTSFYQIIVDFAGPPRHRLTPFLQGIGPLPAHHCTIDDVIIPHIASGVPWMFGAIAQNLSIQISALCVA